MTASEDGRSYDFVLREGASFHNGEPVTAEDVKFSFERYRGVAHDLLQARVAAVETPDARHVRFSLKDPWPDFLTFYATATGAGWIVPKNYVEKVGDDGFKKAPIGAGPYKFVSFNPGVELVLEAFDQYWRKKPAVKRLVFKVIPDESTRLAALKRGEVDIAYSVRGELAEQLRNTPGLTLKPAVVQGHVLPLFPRPVGREVAVARCAGAQGGQPRHRLQGHQRRADAGLLGGHRQRRSCPKGYDFYWQPPAPVYDPDKAKQLLAEAGFPNGFDAGNYFCDSSYANIGESVVDNLLAVGIRCKLRPVERAAFIKEYGEKKYKNIIQAGPGAFGNAATRIEAHLVKGGVFSYGSYPDIDELYQQQAVELDRAKREALLYKIQQIDGRADDLCADLAARLHQRRRAARRRIGFRPDPAVSLHRALRGHHAQGRRDAAGRAVNLEDERHPSRLGILACPSSRRERASIALTSAGHAGGITDRSP